MENRLFI